MKKDLLLLLLVILPAFAILIQPGYFTMHDDLQAARQLEMGKCFEDGQVPCRWVPDMGFGFGYPLFNYYPPLPYYLGQIFRYLGFQYIDIIKVVGILGFIFCAFNMYLLGQEFWGKKGGFVSSLLYTYAPYHSLDFYVRGAMNEFWAMAFYPAIFWLTYKLITQYRLIWLPWLALSVTGLMLSHNPMLMIFAPFIIIWCLFWLWKSHTIKAFWYLLYAAVFALCLAAFFTLPVLFEQKYAHLETLTIGYFNFLAHFVPINRIFWIVNWGYGASNLGQTDQLSYYLGLLQWLLPICVIFSVFFIKKIRLYWQVLVLLVLFTTGSLFMMHSKSTPIWLHFKPLEFVQFPWRFLSLGVFFTSFISGAFVLIIRNNKILLSILISITLVLNAGFFHPRLWLSEITDTVKFSGDSWRLQVTGSIFDYLPIFAPLPPPNPAGSDLGITGGEGTYTRIEKSSKTQKYKLNISSSSAVVELQTFYFPGWHVYLDGKEITIDPTNDPLLGRMKFEISAGEHLVTAIFKDTPIRTVSNTISLLAWISLPLIFYLTSRSDKKLVLV